MSAIPNMLASNKEKDSLEFGLKMAQYIHSEWGGSVIGNWRKEVDLLRSHLTGNVDASHLKKLFVNSGDVSKKGDAAVSGVSALGVDWRYNSPMPKFINAITQSISPDQYKVSVKGIDAHSMDLRSQFKREKKKAMLIKEDAESLSRVTGMDFTPRGFIPESEDELNLYMEMEYKPSTEIATEIAIQSVYDNSSWKETASQVLIDLALHGKCALKVSKDPDTVVSFSRVNIRNFIHSISTSDKRDGSDNWYYGYYEDMTVGEIQRLAKGQLSDRDLKMLASGSEGVSFFANTLESYEAGVKTTALHFAFKCNKYDIMRKRYYKNGAYKLIKKDDYWEPSPESKAHVLKVPYEVWYEGIYLPAIDKVICYAPMNDMFRDPGNHRKALPPYILYDLKSESIGRQIIDISDELYLVKVKLRQLIVKLRPDAIGLNIDGLGGLEMSDGTKVSNLAQAKLFIEDGILLYSGVNLTDGSPRSGVTATPITAVPESSRNKIQELITLHNHLVEQLYDLPGISPQAIGAAPPARTSATVYQQSLGAAQRTYNNIFEGLMNVQKRASETILARLHEASMLGESKELLSTIMGEYTTDILKSMSNVKKYHYKVHIDLKPTQQERQELTEIIAKGIQTKALTMSDLVDIQEIDNLRYAKQVLKIRERRRMEQAQKDAAVAHQRKMQEIQAEAQAAIQKEIAVIKAKAEAEAMLKQIDAQVAQFEKSQELQKEMMKGRYNLAVASQKSQAAILTDKYKENRKDARVGLEAQHRSELIDQQQNKTGPKSFISNNNLNQ